MDIEWMIYHLVHNDDDFVTVSLDIDYYDQDVWDRLLTSLSRNKQLKQIKLVRAENPQSRSRRPFELSNMFLAISKIPTLANVEFLGGFTGWDFNVCVDRGDESFFPADVLFTNHPTITHIRMILSENSTLNRRILESISTVQNLQEVIIEAPNSKNMDVATLCRSPTLTSLRIDTYGEASLDDGYVSNLAGVLSSPRSNLRVLDMDYTISPKGLSYLSTMLQTNSCLKEMRLAIENMGDTDDSSYDDDSDDDNDLDKDDCNNSRNEDQSNGYQPESSLCELMDVLQKKNHALNTFYNYRYRKWSDLSLQTMQNQLLLLEQNTALQTFVLFMDKDDEDDNSDDERRIATKTKNLYLTLNKGGRGRLFRNKNNDDNSNLITKRDWVDVLSNQLTVNNVNCLFYYLTLNPSLCKLEDDQSCYDVTATACASNNKDDFKDTLSTNNEEEIRIATVSASQRNGVISINDAIETRPRSCTRHVEKKIRFS